MSIIVQKYGGSSLADLEKIKQVARKVVTTKDRGYELVVVVSAMGDTTDELMDMARKITPSPNSRELDMLVTVGERVSMALLSMAIHALGYPSISFTGSQSGIITNDTPGSSRILEVRPYRVQDELNRGHIVIVAGYQGVSYKREVTTLGRGGSDTTAVALAAALGAEACEIYSDVVGVYSADPRVVLDARQLQEISYSEMQDLARFGARVLNAEAVEFARRSGIVLYAKSTSADDLGTTIRRVDGYPDRLLEEERASFVTGIAGRKDILLLEYLDTSEEKYRSTSLLDRLGTVDLLFSSTDTARGTTTLVVYTENLRQPLSELAQLGDAMPGELVIRGDLGLVTAVGSRAGYSIAAQHRLLEALHRAEISDHLSFTSRTTVSVVVEGAEIDRALQIAHAEFFGGTDIAED